MHPLHRHILNNNAVDWSHYTPLILGGKNLGRVHHAVADTLLAAKLLIKKDAMLFLNNEKNAAEDKTKQLRDILHHLIAQKIIAKERFELYSVASSFNDTPVALADRALMSAMGFPAYGVHCNGFQKENNTIKLWVGKRSADRAVDAGKLDHMVAGGQPHGLTLFENLLKEAHEEANAPEHLVKHARPVGCITYTKGSAYGVRRDVLFVFDLKLPVDFTPHNQDGETESFYLMPARDVLETITKTDDFKFNVALVLVDFFIRHGMINSDDTGYAELVSGLHPSLA
jgi:8-oxo-dGTP pyrophosphatase MutT (NUDIX family)